MVIIKGEYQYFSIYFRVNKSGPESFICKSTKRVVCRVEANKRTEKGNDSGSLGGKEFGTYKMCNCVIMALMLKLIKSNCIFLLTHVFIYS